MVKETGILLDYDEGMAYIDTSSKADATKCRRAGYVEALKGDPTGTYARFSCPISRLTWGKKGARRGGNRSDRGKKEG